MALTLFAVSAQAAEAHTDHCICNGATLPSAASHTCATVTFTAWTDDLAATQNGTGKTATNSLPATAGNYYLVARDVTITETWEPADGTVLRLNGKTITCTADGHSRSSENVATITVKSGHTFTLTDCNTDNPGKITHTIIANSSGYGSGVAVAGTFNMYGGSIFKNEGIYDRDGVYMTAGAFNLYGGTISQNKAEYGGGVHVTSGNFTMYNGNITGNTVQKNNSNGGGVYVASGSTFNMSGGNIAGNTANMRGGGVYIWTQNGGGNPGTFNMSSGTVANNSAGFWGGGVCTDGKFIMSGGSITGNNAGTQDTSNGGGVYADSHGSFTASGNVQVKDNVQGGTKQAGGNYTDGTTNNVYLPDGKTITVSGALTGGENSIGVTPKTAPTGTGSVVIASAGTNYNTLSNTDKNAFTPDGGTLTISAPSNPTYNGSGKSVSLTKQGWLQNNVGKANDVVYEPNCGTGPTYAPKDAGTYTASITVGVGEGAVTASVEYTIQKADLTTEGTASATAPYGTKVKDISITGLTVKRSGSDAVVSGTWSFLADAADTPAVGSTAEYTATFTPSTGAGNYNPLTVQIAPDITKATYNGGTTANGSAKPGASGTVDLSSLIVSGGTAEVTAVTDEHSVLDTYSVSNDTKLLSFSFKNSATPESTAAITVKVTSANYADYTITVNVTVNSKTVPTITAPTAAENLTYNGAAQTLITAGSTTGGTLEYKLGVDGSYSTALPTATNAATYTVYYRVIGNDDYADVAETGLTVTVGKKSATAKPGAVSITKGSAIPAFALEYTGLLTGDSLTPAPTPEFSCFEADGTTPVSTSTAAGTYTITWTNMDSVSFANTNYDVRKTETATLTVTERSSTSGSSAGKPTVTVPVSSNAGSVEVKAEVSRGTATVKVSDKQLEQVAANGSGTVTIDVSGAKNVERVKLPAQVVEAANKAEDTGLTVALPDGSVALDPTALESASKGEDIIISVRQVPATDLTVEQQETVGDMANVGLVVDVDAYVGGMKQSGFNGGKLTISIPYTPKAGEDTSKLAVWFIRDDGTIENKGGHYDAAKGCFVFETSHLSRYVLVSVNEQFSDVAADAYYAAAVNWAVSRNITNGIGDGKFGPELGCTRAQIVTFLYRCAVAQGVDVSIGESTNILSYTDALEVPEFAFEAFQ